MSEEVKAAPVTETVEQPTAAPEASKETTQAQVDQPFKAFATEEEFNNFVKSTSSKAKHSILQEFETKSVDEGKQKMSQAEELQKDLQTAVTRLTQLEEENAVVKLGINDEFRDEALTLARAKVSDKKTLDAALQEVTQKFPNLLKGTVQGEKIEKIGGEKTQVKPSDANSIKDNLKKKYPWLKNI
jgi:hypothetical protein